MEDGKGDSCPAGILRVTFYKQVFLFNHSQILVHFFTQDSISYMNKNVFLVNKKCSLGEQKCSLDDRLGEQNCSERLLDQRCWVMIILVNRFFLFLHQISMAWAVIGKFLIINGLISISNSFRRNLPE